MRLSPEPDDNFFASAISSLRLSLISTTTFISQSFSLTLFLVQRCWLLGIRLLHRENSMGVKHVFITFCIRYSSLSHNHFTSCLVTVASSLFSWESLMMLTLKSALRRGHNFEGSMLIFFSASCSTSFSTHWTVIKASARFWSFAYLSMILQTYKSERPSVGFSCNMYGKLSKSFRFFVAYYSQVAQQWLHRKVRWQDVA